MTAPLAASSNPLPFSSIGVDTLVDYLEERRCVLFRDKDDFKRKLTVLVAAGPGGLRCIADFDFTLSKYFKDDGVSRADSCHASLENAHKSGLLPPDYITRAKALQAHYYPLEIDTTISECDKFRFMEEWVEKHNALLVESRITPRTIKTVVSQAIDERRLILRQGLESFISILEQHNIPTLIFSAGIADVVEAALNKTLGVSSLPPFLSLISNKAIFQDANDDDSPLVDWSRPALHVLNKRASSFLDHPFFTEVTAGEKKNLLLLGDSIGDPRMCMGIEDDCDTILKVGFLNVSVEERKAEFLEAYDLLVLGDPELDLVILPILQLVIIQLK